MFITLIYFIVQAPFSLLHHVATCVIKAVIDLDLDENHYLFILLTCARRIKGLIENLCLDLSYRESAQDPHRGTATTFCHVTIIWYRFLFMFDVRDKCVVWRKRQRSIELFNFAAVDIQGSYMSSISKVVAHWWLQWPTSFLRAFHTLSLSPWMLSC